MISVTHVISTISNEKALLIFKAVALSQSHDSKMLVAKLNLTHREFYSNMKKLIDTGLLKRTRCRYHLTSFGKIVFSAQAQVEIAIENYWKLKAFDSIMMSADKIHLPAEESQIIVDKLIENQEIKAIVIPNKKLS